MIHHAIWWHAGGMLDVTLRSFSSWSKDVACDVMGLGGMGYGGSKKRISFRLLVVCCTKKPLDEHATGKEDR